MNELINNQIIRRSIVAVLVLLSVFLLAKSINEFKLNSTIGKNNFSNTIVVRGEGKVFAVPDIATFSFSVTEEAVNVKNAQDVVSEKISKILDVLEDFNIDDKDIKTQSYNIYPKYEFVTTNRICPAGSYCPPISNRVISGYEVSQTISVKLRETDKSGEVLGALAELGVSNINGPFLDVDNREELEREARKMAIDDAKKQAKELAKDLDIKLSRIVSFSEGGNFGVMARFDAVPEGVGMGGSFEPEIPVGENEIRSSVEIVYEIR